MPLEPGTLLGPYEILAPLGAGGMGEVHRARDTRLGREAAIKALPDAFALDPDRLARFEREAKLLASLSHPNIAGVYGLEVVDGHRYLAMEFVDGETLAARLARGPLPVDEAVQVGAQIAAAVEAAHEAGVIHRDLKPGNVMLKPDGTIKVLDFGLAKSGAAADSPGGAAGSKGGTDLTLSSPPTLRAMATEAGIILGTAAYMSPEQARGKVVDRRTDIWSFGCVLYECLTGRPVHDGETISDVIARILEREPDWSTLPAATPPHVRQLLKRCLARDPKLRLRDIGEARIALESPAEAALAGGGAGDGAAGGPPTSPARRSVPWTQALAAVVVVGLVAAAAAWLAKPAGPGGGLGATAVRKLDLVAPRLDLHWYLGPLLSPDGRRVLYSATGRIWVRDLDQLEARSMAEIPDLSPLAWSPEGDFVAYAARKKLWRAPAAGGAPVAICDIPGTGSLVGIAWGKDDTIVFSVWRGSLHRVSITSGKPERILEADPALVVDYHAPSFLPDGSILFISHWKSDTDESGERRPYLSILDGKDVRHVTGQDFADESWPVYWNGHLLWLRGEPNTGLWAMRFDVKKAAVSGDPIRVAADAGSISLAADGSLLYVETTRSETNRELGWMDRSGGWLGRIGAVRVGLAQPSFSPDRKRIAFVAGAGEDREIWVHDLARGAETRLTFEPGEHVRPRWFDDRRILHATWIGSKSTISLRSAAGSGSPRMLTQEGGLGLGDAIFEVTGEPDGFLQIVDAAGRGSLRHFRFDAQGVAGESERILRGDPEPNVTEMRLSPDRRMIAYIADDGGVPEIYLSRYPSGDGKWQVSTDGGRTPRWDPATGALYYVTGTGPTRRTLMEVEVRPDEEIPVGRQQAVFTLGQENTRYSGFDWGYEVEPGGKRLLVVRPVLEGERATPRMVLVQNWAQEFAELRGK